MKSDAMKQGTESGQRDKTWAEFSTLELAECAASTHFPPQKNCPT